MLSRRSVLALVAGFSVISAGIGWVAGQRIKSPAEVAAATAAPTPSLITVPVELRELASRVVVRATLQSSEETPIEVTGSSLGTAVVTRMPKQVGDELLDGEVAIEVAGRPVIVLQGELPVYRSMSPSMEGPDVEQLEAALLRLGYDPGTVDGKYTGSTSSAVAALFNDLGYQPNSPGSDEEAVLEGAEDRVAEAARTVQTLEAGTGAGGVPDSVRLQADLSVQQAERAVTDATAGRADAIAEAETALTEANAALHAANEAEATAQARLEAAQAGTHPDTDTSPTPAELDTLADDLAAAEQIVQGATAEQSTAQAARNQVATEQDRMISDAEAQLAIAKAQRTETFASYTDGAEGEGSGVSLADARKQLADAREDLAELQAVTGTTFPAAELVFVPTLPRVVQSVSVSLGSVAGGTVMTVIGADTTLESAVSDSDRKLLSEGLEARVEDDELGISAPATITFVANNPGGGELSSDRYRMRLTPTEELPEEALLQSLRVTIPISSTGGEVLAVPLAAVSAGSDGRPRVEVQRSDGSTELVSVTTGLAAEGFVEVTPVGDLDAGDQVVVGRDLQLPGQEADGESSDGETDDGEDAAG